MAVNTAGVTGRRQLHFSSYQDILDDVHKLSSVPTQQLGNWSLGQICQHLAAAMDMAIDGPPFHPAWYVRLIAPMLKKRFLTRPMSPGFKLPKNAGTLLPPEISTNDGIAALEKSIVRIQQGTNLKPHPVFGAMTRQEWDQLEFRHSEMHLSFVSPR